MGYKNFTSHKVKFLGSELVCLVSQFLAIKGSQIPCIIAFNTTMKLLKQPWIPTTKFLKSLARYMYGKTLLFESPCVRGLSSFY